jgi:hypothetical protein
MSVDLVEIKPILQATCCLPYVCAAVIASLTFNQSFKEELFVGIPKTSANKILT